MVNPHNPYEKRGERVLRGNLHTHTANSRDAEIPPEEVIELYDKAGFDFLALTEHNYVTCAESYASRMQVFAGVEADFSGKYHTNIINFDSGKIAYDGERSQQDLIDQNIAKGALVFLNHPDSRRDEHYPIDVLRSLEAYHGIEIYNSVVERETYSAYALSKWDKLLADGRHVFGFVNQDFHEREDLTRCANVVWSEDNSAEAIFSALKSGCFYGDNGVEILDIRREGMDLHIETRNAELIRFIGYEGRLRKKVLGSKASYTFSEEFADKVIRIECLGIGDEASFSQAFFR